MALTKDRLVADVADLTTTDKVGSYLLGAGNEVLTATDVGGKIALDVRVAEGINVEVDLSHVDDSVRLGDGTNLTSVTAAGELLVKDADVLTELESIDTHAATIAGAVSGTEMQVDIVTDLPLEFATDSVTAHQGGDWSVKLTDGTDELEINTDGSINVNVTDVIDYPTNAVKSTGVSVTDTAAALLGAQLTDRRAIYVQNLSNKDIYIGASDVTLSNGLRVARGATVDFPFGSQISLYAIGDTGILGANNVRVLELA